MTLKNKFLHTHSHLPGIPRNRLIIGIFAGLLFAFSFYSFIYIFREALRISFFMTEDNDVLILSDHTVNLLNFIFASIACIMGQSLCFTCWFETPLRKLGKYTSRMRTIINDQRSMNSYFLSWFSRMAVVFFLVISSMGGGIYVIETYAEYFYLFIFIIPVLFLHTWMNINRLFNGIRSKWMLLSAIILFIISFGMSRINLIDYKQINEIILKKNIFHTYNFQLPESKYSERMDSKSKRKTTLWIVEDKNSNSKIEPAIFTSFADNDDYDNDGQLPLDSLEAYFNSENLNSWHYKHSPCVLYIHRNIKMGYVNMLKKKLAELETFQIQYAVLPTIREYDERYYTYLALPMVTGRYFIQEDAWLEVQKDLKEVEAVYDLYNADNGKVIFDTITLSYDDFSDYIKQKIKPSPNYIIKYHIHDDSSFADYIYITSIIRQALYELRNEYSLEVYQEEFDYLDWDVAKKVINKYPNKVLEIVNQYF